MLSSELTESIRSATDSASNEIVLVVRATNAGIRDAALNAPDRESRMRILQAYYKRVLRPVAKAVRAAMGGKVIRNRETVGELLVSVPVSEIDPASNSALYEQLSHPHVRVIPNDVGARAF